MDTAKVLKAAVFAAMFAVAAAAQVLNVAVVETEVDAASADSIGITKAEVRLVTSELRREAVKNLPPARFNIMTTETVYAQGSAVLEDCAEENCVITLGARIGADFIVRGIISKLRERFTLSVEVYETENGNLVASSAAVRSDRVDDLVEKAAPACAEMYEKFLSAQGSRQKPAERYVIVVRANPAKGGTVLRNPNQDEYRSGTSVDVAAMPAKGYTFAGWSGAAVDMANPITITMDDNKMLVANFKPIAQRAVRKGYTLSTNVFPSAAGTVIRTPDEEIYEVNQKVTLTVAEEHGYLFMGWMGVETDRKNNLKLTKERDLTITMDGYKGLAAKFSRIDYDWYIAPKYQISFGTPVAWGGANLEFGQIWGEGMFWGGDLSYGLDAKTDDYLIGAGCGLGSVYDLGNLLRRVYDFGNKRLLIAYGGYAGYWQASVSGRGGDVANFNLLAPFVKLRWRFIELTYRGLLGIKEFPAAEYIGFTYEGTDHEWSFGWNNHQLMLGLHYETSNRWMGK